jgi:hypothetical protein
MNVVGTEIAFAIVVKATPNKRSSLSVVITANEKLHRELDRISLFPH